MLYTGNIRDQRKDGRLIVQVRRFCDDDFLLSIYDEDYTFTASFEGWYRRHNVGTGATREAAIADLQRICCGPNDSFQAHNVLIRDGFEDCT